MKFDPSFSDILITYHSVFSLCYREERFTSAEWVLSLCTWERVTVWSEYPGVQGVINARNASHPTLGSCSRHWTVIYSLPDTTLRFDALSVLTAFLENINPLYQVICFLMWVSKHPISRLILMVTVFYTISVVSHFGVLVFSTTLKDVLLLFSTCRHFTLLSCSCLIQLFLLSVALVLTYCITIHVALRLDWHWTVDSSHLLFSCHMLCSWKHQFSPSLVFPIIPSGSVFLSLLMFLVVCEIPHVSTTCVSRNGETGSVDYCYAKHCPFLWPSHTRCYIIALVAWSIPTPHPC